MTARYRLVLGLLTSLILSSGAAEPRPKRLAQLPPPVRQTIDALVGDGRLLDLERTEEKGQAVYEGEFRRDGKVRGFAVAVDGMLTARQLFEEELPAEVQRTLRAQLADTKPGAIYWTNDDGDPAYFAEFTRAGVGRSLTIAPDGWLSAREMSLAELPEPVRLAAARELKGASPVRIDRVDDGLEISFDITLPGPGGERTVSFDPAGNLVAEEISASELPPAARKRIDEHRAGARAAGLFKWQDDGETFFEAVFVRNGTRHGCTVLGDGSLASTLLPLSQAPAPVRKAVEERRGFVVRIEHHRGEGENYFEVRLRAEGKTRRLEFHPDGAPR